MSMLDPIHPGEILEEEFMKPLELSANALARALDVPVTRVSEIVRGRRGITADTALRLARLLGTTPEFWLGLQSDFDLKTARRDAGRTINDAVSPLRGDRVLDQLEVREPKVHYGSTSASGLDRRRRRKTVAVYSAERKAEFLIANATDAKDRKKADEEVRRMGLDPRKVRPRRESKR